MKRSKTSSRTIGEKSGGRGTTLRIGALGALIITLVLVGCPPVPTTETLILATNLQRRIAPAGILLSWDAPTAGNVAGFNVYNGIDAGALNGAPLNASARSYAVTGLTANSVYAFELETISNLSDGGSLSLRIRAVPIRFADLPAGSAANPWLVDSAAELRSIATGFRSTAAANGGTDATPLTLTTAQSLTAHYFQLADITLCDDATDSDCDPFVPIGNDYPDASGTTDTPFSGSYDGGGNAISGLRVDGTTASAIQAWGLFGLVSGAAVEIRDVTLRDPAVTGTFVAGTLVGRLLDDATVADSAAVGGTITATGAPALIGGLVGDSSGEIANSAATVTVNSSDTASSGSIKNHVGGLVGRLAGSTAVIENSYATGVVNGGARTDNIGGLVGYMTDESPAIENSYATGDVHSGESLQDPSNIGGLVGLFDATGTIQNSYATGAVNGGDRVSNRSGGLVGQFSSGTIQNSYATGAVNSVSEAFQIVGGLVGLVVSGTIQNSYATGAVDGGAGSGDNAGGLVGGFSGFAGSMGTIENSYATGAVDGGAGDNDTVGGLVGSFSSTGTIRNSYATGDVDGGAGDDSIGGLVGTNNGGTITNAYHSGTDVDAGETNGDGDDFTDPDEARMPEQLLCPSNADLAVGAVPAGGFTVPTDASSGCTVSGSDAGVIVYDDDSDDTGELDGWSSANWDFGSATELPSVIGTDGVELPGQPITITP